MIESLTHESFEPHIGTSFAISDGTQDELLTLVEVAQGRGHPDLARQPFSLIFNGVRTDGRFEQHMFTLNHPEMGAVELFLVVIGRNPDGTYIYQASFS